MASNLGESELHEQPVKSKVALNELAAEKPSIKKKKRTFAERRARFAEIPATKKIKGPDSAEETQTEPTIADLRKKIEHLETENQYLREALVHDSERGSAEIPGKALCSAVQLGCLETVRELLNQGADPNVPWCNGEYYSVLALQEAIDLATQDMEKKLAIARLLLEKGADPNKSNGWWLPLHAAIVQWLQVDQVQLSTAYFSLISMLLEAGASPATTQHKSALAVMVEQLFPCSRRLAKVVDLFLCYGMGINDPQDEHGNTLLHLAVRYDYDYSFLLKRGATIFFC